MYLYMDGGKNQVLYGLLYILSTSRGWSLLLTLRRTRERRRKMKWDLGPLTNSERQCQCSNKDKVCTITTSIGIP